MSANRRNRSTDRRRAPGTPRQAGQNQNQRRTSSASGGRRQQPSRPVRGNSIEFPVQQTAGSPVPRGDDRGTARPRPARSTAGSAPPRTTNQADAQRMRPAQGRQAVRDPVRREKRKRRRMTRAEMRRRRMMRRLTAFVLTLCVAAAGIYLTVTMLFKINTIQVRTADGTVVQEAGGYSSEEILQALGVQPEENIFSFRPAEKEAELEKAFPLLEQIAVVRKYPNTVVVRVTEATPTYAMHANSGWLTLSDSFKILSVSLQQPDLPTLYGGEPASSVPGEQLDYAAPAAESGSADSDGATAESEAPEDQRMDALQTLISALKSRDLFKDVTRIEFADTDQVAFLYQDRVSVLLGTLNELDYKLDFAAYLLHNTDGKGCSETDTGLLDCSHVRSDGTLRPILAQGEPTLPSGYVVPAPPEEAAPEQPQQQDEAAAPGEEAAVPDAGQQQTEQ